MARPPGPNQTEEQRQRAEAMRQWRDRNLDRAKATARASYQRNKAHRLALNRAWRQQNPEKEHAIARRGYLRRWYGLTVAQYEAMLLAQGGVCRICLKPPESRYLDIDHDHKTGTVRGLLCRKCNAILGLADDAPDLFQRAADYLAARKAETA